MHRSSAFAQRARAGRQQLLGLRQRTTLVEEIRRLRDDPAPERAPEDVAGVIT